MCPPTCDTRCLQTLANFGERHFHHQSSIICRQSGSLYQDVDRTMQILVWHKDDKAVCHYLAAIFTQDTSS